MQVVPWETEFMGASPWQKLGGEDREGAGVIRSKARLGGRCPWICLPALFLYIGAVSHPTTNRSLCPCRDFGAVVSVVRWRTPWYR